MLCLQLIIAEQEVEFVHFCCYSDQNLFLVVWSVLLSFCGLTTINFLLHLLDIFKSFKGSAHLLVNCQRRRHGLEEKGSVYSAVCLAFLAANPFTQTTQPTRLCSRHFLPYTLRAGHCKSSRAQSNNVPAHESLATF